MTEPWRCARKRSFSSSGHAREQLDHALFGLVVERAASTPWPSRIAKPISRSASPSSPANARAIVGVAAQEAAEVAGADAVVLVEGLDVARLGQVVLLALLDLVVADVVLVRRLDAPLLAIAHACSPIEA